MQPRAAAVHEFKWKQAGSHPVKRAMEQIRK
jgi:hypothetical protein